MENTGPVEAALKRMREDRDDLMAALKEIISVEVENNAVLGSGGRVATIARAALSRATS